MTSVSNISFQPNTTASRWCAQEVLTSRPMMLATESAQESHIGLGVDYAAGMLRNLKFIGEDKNREARFI